MGGTVIYEDTRQQAGKHDVKHAWFEAHGVKVVRRKLDAGYYMRDGSNFTVDTKRSVDELAMNINGKSHDRFRRECERAADGGLVLVVLVENANGYREVADVRRWTNTHCRVCPVRLRGECAPRNPRGRCLRHGTMKPIQGDRLAKAMVTMAERYAVRFELCAPEEAARRICEILGVNYEQDAGGRA